MLLDRNTTQMAEALGCTEQWVRIATKHPEFMRQLADLEQLVHADIDAAMQRDSRDLHLRMTEDAAEAYDELLDIMRTSDDRRLVKDVAQDLLDRAGHSATRKMDIRSVSIDAATIARIFETQRMMEEPDGEQPPIELGDGGGIECFNAPTAQHTPCVPAPGRPAGESEA
jgi:hypothetical protein